VASKKIQTDEEKQRVFSHVAKVIEEHELGDYLLNSFLPYAYSVILDRALTDVTGLKPVQRRILHTANVNNVSDKSSRMKVAKFKGLVLAYHPHSDSSVEDALTRMAQPNAVRVPLIDGKGNFGDVGPLNPAAAGRYIEARLTSPAMELISEISEHAVELVPNYDGTDTEPLKLPARWPVALINGSEGIAVGYASKMPSHNPMEIMKACKAVLKNPDIKLSQLLKIVPGPDFNMGGIIPSADGIKEYMETGQGSFKIRGKYTSTLLPKGRTKIEFFELPAGVWAEKIIEEIQKQQERGSLSDLLSYKNLSDHSHPTRFVIETKPGVQIQRVLIQLFKTTSLEASFSVNMTTVINGRPIRTGIRPLIEDFLKFRQDCIINKTNYKISVKDNRLHILAGLLAALLDIDKAIAIIRNSDTVEDAHRDLIKTFKIDKVQSEYILSMPLRRLTKQDTLTIETEKKELQEELVDLKLILSSPDRRQAFLLDELDATAKVLSRFNLQTETFTTERRTEIQNLTEDELKQEQSVMAQAARDEGKNIPCYLTRFADNRILKSTDPFEYSKADKKFVNSPIIEQMRMKTQDAIVIVGSDGIGRRIPLSYITIGIPSSHKDMGLNFPRGVTIVGMSKNESAKSDIGLAIATTTGQIKIAKTDYPRGDEFPVVLLDEGEKVMGCRWIGRALTNTLFALVSRSGNVLTFDAKTIRVSGSRSGAVKGMKLKNSKDTVISFGWVDAKSPDNVLITQGQKTTSLTLLNDIPNKNKGGMGVAGHGFAKGEDSLKNAWVGCNAIASLTELGNAVNLPVAGRRAGRGVDFNLDVNFGSFDSKPL
jgi:DNA gyrase subunit A